MNRVPLECRPETSRMQRGCGTTRESGTRMEADGECAEQKASELKEEEERKEEREKRKEEECAKRKNGRRKRKVGG